MLTNLSNSDLFLLLFLAIGVMIVMAFIIRTICSIPKILRYQKALLKLQALTAEKLNVDDEIVTEIMFKADPSFKKDPSFAPDKSLEINTYSF